MSLLRKWPERPWEISPGPSECLLRASPWVKEPHCFLLSPRAGAEGCRASAGRFIIGLPFPGASQGSRPLLGPGLLALAHFVGWMIFPCAVARQIGAGSIYMNRWQQIEKICHAALGLKESRWAAFLEQACTGDEALRQKVESLLKFDRHGDRFIE